MTNLDKAMTFMTTFHLSVVFRHAKKGFKQNYKNLLDIS